MNSVVNKHNIIKLFTYIFTIIFVISIFFVVKSYAKDKDLNISKVEIVEKSDGVTGEITSSTDGIVKDNITFHKLNDYVVYKIKIDNDLDKDIVINTITDNNDNPYITYEYDKHENETIKSGSSTNLLVKVIYKNDMSDLTKRNQTSDVRFTIDFSEGETTIGINPKTNDGIGINFIVLIVSFVGLVTCLIIKTKVFSKKAKVLIMLMVGFISLPLITKAITLTLNLSINTNYNFYDKVILTYNIDGEEKTKVVPYGTKVEDVDFNYPEGYSVVNWKDKNNNSVSLNDKLKEDIKIEGNLVYSETPEITAVNFDKFSYTADKAKAYYVSTSSTAPQASDVQDNFELNKWTTATTTNYLSLSEGLIYYVYVMDNNNNVSINKATVAVRRITLSNSRGVDFDLNIPGYFYFPGTIIVVGANYDIPSSDSVSTLILEGSSYSYSSSVVPGFENYHCTKNGEETLTAATSNVYGDTTINCSATVKTIAVTFDPMGGEYEDSTGLTIKMAEFAKSTMYSVGVPTKEGYLFEGWYSEITGGDMIFNKRGYQTSMGTGLKYFANVSGGIGGANVWVYPNDITVYAHWTPSVSISTEDFNSFTYESPTGVAYYVSNNSTSPVAGTPQSSFELDKWTTAQSTGDLVLNDSQMYYVWAIDSDGTITSTPAYIMSHSISNPPSNKYTLEVRLNDSTGDIVDFGSDNTVYVLSNTKLYTLFEGINDYRVFNGTIRESNCDHDIYDTTTTYYCDSDNMPISSSGIVTVRADIIFGADTYYSPPLIIGP